MPSATFALYPRARARTAAAFAGAALLLAGCQGGSAPGGSPSATNSTTTSPTSSVSVSDASPSPTASPAYKPADATGKAQNVPVPVMPELAKENSKAGLEAFIGYWYATFSYATETGNLGPWMDTTDTAIPVAAAYKEAVERNYAQGRWMVGGRISTPVVDVLWADGASIQEAKVQVIQSETSYHNADGTISSESTPASNIAEAVFTKFTEGAWQVTDNGMIVG
ncbi:hypothetical protein SAMN04487917_10640 [Arthrobacter sp. yr096]|uniref:DUF6318 family protein n=1 Tax=Arthrobacter sp. yr096 TaxID=1761750 RepID=UPI0008D710B5|nr:DUF6318 family protein [Arthrobacter sp. yr096]SEJ46339.1 hypothetical protein SAMN04487917_10640 [Arthrobacter sp. yr096]